jgi:hypothetical protein
MLSTLKSTRAFTIAAGTNSIVFARTEPPVQYENRNFRVKNGKTGSLDPSMTMDWMERTGTVSYGPVVWNFLGFS